MNKITANQPGGIYSDNAQQAIILAGGPGTKQQSSAPDLPVCMSPVAGRPFLFYVINQLRLQGIEHIIFSLGYKHEIIEAYLANQYPALSYECVIGEQPLGTGGAILHACEKVSSKNVLVADGDTLYKANVQKLFAFHGQQGTECALALKPMHHFDRYGAVELDEKGTIIAFNKKQYHEYGLMNSGMYALDVAGFLEKKFPPVFSFEKDYLEPFSSQGNLKGIVDDSYFINIGIPEDFQRAQVDLKRPSFAPGTIDNSWTLFLDRDGVINHDNVGSYIFEPGEFRFYDGVPHSMKILSERFGRVIIATNQRGVGRDLMSVDDLDSIHAYMRTVIGSAGGRVDAIFYATSVNNDDFDRKPNPGMAIKARRLYPEIDYSRSVMVGNNTSDMQFGRNAGMYTVFLKTTQDIQLPHEDIDMAFNSLPEFANSL